MTVSFVVNEPAAEELPLPREREYD